MDEDYVETSDIDELQELEIQHQGFVEHVGERSHSDSPSPRKRVKLDHNPREFNISRSRSLSPQYYPSSLFSTTSTPSRSQSSNTIFNNSSPGLITASPTKLVSQPLVEFDEDVNHSDSSQDPLLLENDLASHAHMSSSPSNKFTDLPGTPSAQRSSSPNLLSIDLISSNSSSPSVTVNRPDRPTTHGQNSNDDLLSFSPAKASSSYNKPLSPLTPPPTSLQRVHDAPHSPSSSPPPAAQSPPEDVELPVPVLAQENGRYPLRRRQALQLAPYSVEQFNYKRALGAVPEAIIKFRNLGNHHQRRHIDDRYENEDETQGEGFEYEAGDEDEDADWEAQERRRMRLEKRREDDRRSLPPGSPHQGFVSKVLKDLSSDEEEDREMRTLSKEAKKILKEKERQRKAKEKEERENRRREEKEQALSRKHRTKAFPLSTKSQSPEVDRDERSPRRTSSLPHSQPQSRSPPTFGGRDVAARTVRATSLASRGNTPAAEGRSSPPQDDLNYADFEPFPDFQVDTAYAMDLDEDIPLNLVRPSSRNSTPILTNSRETAIEIESDNEVPKETTEAVSDADPVSSLDPTSRRRLRALHRMMPKFMAQQWAEKKPKQKQPVRHDILSSGSEAEEAGPLLPGRTRVSRASKPKDIREIRGDTESSEDEKDDGARGLFSGSERNVSSARSMLGHSSESDVVEMIYSRRDAKHVPPDIINISDDTSSDSDDSIGASDIDEHLRQSKRPASKRMREGDLIDWMLSRSRKVNTSKKKSKRSAPPARRGIKDSSLKYKYDVTTYDTRRYGQERQTLLNFDGHTKQKQQSTASLRSQIRTTSSKRSWGRMDADDDDIPFKDPPAAGSSKQIHVVIEERKKKSFRQKQKERRERIRKNGLYTFTSGGATHITSGRQRQRPTKSVTINLRDNTFYHALAPLSQKNPPPEDWVKFFEPPRPPLKRRPRRKSPEHANKLLHVDQNQGSEGDQSHLSEDELDRRSHHKAPVDLGILPIPSGSSFGMNSFIAKGWLHDLIAVINGTSEPLRPQVIFMSSLEFGPAMDINLFCTSLGKVMDDLFAFVNDIPDADNADQAKKWVSVMRGTCQLLSWLWTTADDGDRRTIQDKVAAQVIDLVTKFRALSLTGQSLDDMIFSILWFAIELSARSGCRLPASRTIQNPLAESSMLLVQYLLDYGLKQTMTCIKEGQITHDDPLAYLSAELWIRLFHLLESCTVESNQTKKTQHPIWQTILAVFRTEPYEQKYFLVASEEIWTSLFSLCALSQFSIHGMSMTVPRISACWDLVTIALKKIRLAADPRFDDLVPNESLRNRDEYIAAVIERCTILCTRWNWRLVDASALFTQLMEIFRSRKFGNLRNEKADYPLFMRKDDWDGLLVSEPKDTTFTRFLKLIVRAVDSNLQGERENGISPKIKKLLSLAIPVGSLSWKKDEASQDLSLLFNRLSSVATGLYLDPENYTNRIAHARTYLNFADAHSDAQCALMRGVLSFATFMIKKDIPLDPIAEWIEDMTLTLTKEFNGYLDAEKSKLLSTNVVNIEILLRVVQKLLEVFEGKKTYPEPALLASVKRILYKHELHDISRLAGAIRDVIEGFLVARSAALPSPDRPKRCGDDEESQDQYGGFDFDFDLNDPALVAALDGSTEPQAGPDLKAKQAALQPLAERLVWFCFQFLKKTVQSKGSNNECDSWIKCWLGCADVADQPGKHLKLHDCIRRRYGWLKDPSPQWRRRIDLNVALRALQIDPMTYNSHNEFIFEVFMEALGSSAFSMESEFVSLVLSIDALQHPLFQGAFCLPATIEGEYKLSEAEFEELRLPLLKVIFGNLDSILREATTAGPVKVIEAQSYVGYCIKMFAAMRDHNLVVKTERYSEWCRQVFKMLQQYQEVQSEARLGVVRWKQILGLT